MAATLRHHAPRISPGLVGDAMLGSLVVAWTAAVAAWAGEDLHVSIIPLLVGPTLAAIAALALGEGRRRAPRLLTGWMVIVTAAMLSLFYVVPHTLVAAGIPAVVVSATLARRWPAVFVTGIFLASSIYGTSQAFLHTSLAPLADWLLGGLWLGAVWAHLFAGSARRVAPLPGLVVLAAYVGLSVVELFTSGQGITVALQDFRGSIWYMMAFLLLVIAPLPRETVRRAAYGFVMVAVLVGAYATFRWLTGQSHQELANAAVQTPNNQVDGRIRLFGSFVSGKELSFWTATAIPFCLAFALAFGGRRRLIALSAAALCAIAMFGADVRVALVAVVPAVGVVLALYQSARAFPGLHLGATLATVFGVAVLGAGAFALTLGGHSDTSNRYRILLTAPARDPSYQARLFKWSNAWQDIGHHPLGQGLGVSGRTQQRYGRFLNISNDDIDNSYLKIALEQGFGVMVLYAVGFLLLTWGLARRAAAARDGPEAAMAIGAVGALVCMAIFWFAGTYVEGLPALSAWLLVGLGAAGVTGREAAPRPEAVSVRALGAPVGAT